MSTVLPLNSKIRFGAMATAADRDHALKTVSTLSKWGYDGIWTGDHVAFTGPIDDSLTQLTYLSALNPELIFGTSIYLLPLRPPPTVAKMVASVDRLMGAGHFIFGVGVGGEFPPEYEACGVPVNQRGGRANEAIEITNGSGPENRSSIAANISASGKLRCCQNRARPADLRCGSADARKPHSSVRRGWATDGCRMW